MRAGGGEPSVLVRSRVTRARERALERNGVLNGAIPSGRFDECAPLAPAAHDQLRTELELGRLSGRGLHRIRRVARTIADLADDPSALVEAEHVALALQFRVTVGASLRRSAA